MQLLAIRYALKNPGGGGTPPSKRKTYQQFEVGGGR
jgi:hypothetical protein